MNYYNFRKPFLTNEEVFRILPHINIEDKPTDKTKIWNSEGDRLDIISNLYYNHPYGSQLILLKNKQFGLDEFEWDNGINITIPFPYNSSIQQFIEEVQTYLKLYY
jgi:hypothetical protein